MNATLKQHSSRQRPHSAVAFLFFLSLSSLLIVPAAAAADTQIVLDRASREQQAAGVKGVVDLAINPGFDNARVTVLVDGQKVADGLLSPYHVVVDFGPTAIEHTIKVIARGTNGKRMQWTETINRGIQPLSVRVKPIDASAGSFSVIATALPQDPIEVVQLWEGGKVIASDTTSPYHFNVPAALLESGFVQVTAKTKSGEEAADFWSAAGNVVAEELQIRTVPIFVSVVDRDGNTHDDVDRSMFRIIDGNEEGEIIEFGKAFDQPISIALLLDSSSSMTYSLEHATKAAAEFARHALKDGDRCSVTAVQDVPRVKHALDNDREGVTKALGSIVAQGQTALYDALAFAIRDLRGEKNRRAIVMLTDGADTSSTYDFSEIEKLAREAAIPIYFIAYEGSDDDGRNLDRLRHLATQTGGFVATATQQNLMARYQAIERDLRAQFAITYQISDFGRTNEWRPVRVLVDSRELSARTIKGYFTP